MEAEIEQKIEETVLEILKSSDVNVATLSMVLNMATAKLSLNLSQPDRKTFVKQVVYTYLLNKLTKSQPGPDQRTNAEPEPDQLTKAEPEPDKDDSAADQPTNAEPEPDKDDSAADQPTNAEPEPDKANNAAKQTDEEPEERKRKGGDSKEYDDNGDLIICKLSERRMVTIQDYRLKKLVSIREYYTRDSKGISFTVEEWSAFKKNVPAIEKAIEKMESRLN